MIRLLVGGNFKEKGYYYTIGAFVPKFMYKNRVNFINGGKSNTTIIEFPTSFQLTTNNFYFNISIRVFGFGIGLEIHTRS